MGLFGMMKFAHVHHLVKRRPLRAPEGCFTPIAVDLWNVMYTLVVKYQRQYPTHGKELVTVRCLGSLLRVFAHRSLYPIFVTDRGINCSDHIMFGAKAILTRTMAQCKTDTDASFVDTSPPPSPISAVSAGASFANMRRRVRVSDHERSDSAPQGTTLGKPALALSHHVCVRLLRALGYAYIDSGRMEADDACANLYHTNTVAYVHTTDTDLLLMGCDIVFDVNMCYLPTIRCRDLLKYFQMSYPQFLALFARCHTDLHPNGTHSGVEDVLRECGWSVPSRSAARKAARRARAVSQHVERPMALCEKRRTRVSWGTFLDPMSPEDGSRGDPGTACGHYDDEEGWELATARKGRYPLEPLVLPELSDASDGQLEADHRDYVVWRKRHVIRDAPDALDWLPEPTTIGELVDRRYVKYVISLIAPKRCGQRSLLKRVPIYQDVRNEELVRSLVDQQLASREDAADLADQLCVAIPPPGDYRAVLSDFWDGE
ncbi:tegument host shutoff protein [Bovine alphaherpesvirus 2]|uniref:Virion host shutoff protein n=1 Tax=Bovine alphaherpesvirus 2 TaxID=10295 RepID=Q91HI5_9ALPH|nr:virion host shutoff protein [Bovine alphaherpesvirus 2]QIC50125.1 virion host shutoff protein [Bovine alphaherpesvirus 2]QPO25250.1 tegument host shutoff protein [Bovine alphaherpesvirus 2]